MERHCRIKLDLPGRLFPGFVFLCFAFAVGGVVGLRFAAHSMSSPSDPIYRYLLDYISVFSDSGSVLVSRDVVFSYVLLFLILAVCSASLLGGLMLPFFFAWKGFFLSYSVGLFARLSGSGALFGWTLFGIPALFWVPAAFMFGSRGMIFSFKLLRCTLFSARPPALARDDLICILVCAVLLLLCICVECVLMPHLLRAAAGFVLES